MATPHFVTLPASDDPAHLRAHDAPNPVRLAYSYWAPIKADPTIAPVLVFLPSEGTDVRSIHREQLTCSALRDNAHLIALDLRGCGFSQHPLPDTSVVRKIEMANVLAQDVLDALTLLPGSPFQAGPGGKSRLTIVGTSVASYIALRVAAKLGNAVGAVVLISPAAEVESELNAQSFDEMVDAWHMTNEEVVQRYPDAATLLHASVSVKVPLLVSGGFQARLLNEEPWPPKLLSALTAHWRRRWLSAKGASKDLELFVHAPCALRKPLGESWTLITAPILVIRGDQGQPNGNGQEEVVTQTPAQTASSLPPSPLGAPIQHTGARTAVWGDAPTMPMPMPMLSAPSGTQRRHSGQPFTDAGAGVPESYTSGSARIRHRTESLSSMLSFVSQHSSPNTSTAQPSVLPPTTAEASLRSIMDTNAMMDELRRMSADVFANGPVTGAGAGAGAGAGDGSGSGHSVAPASPLATDTARDRAASNASVGTLATSVVSSSAGSGRSRTASDVSSFFAQIEVSTRTPGMDDVREDDAEAEHGHEASGGAWTLPSSQFGSTAPATTIGEPASVLLPDPTTIDETSYDSRPYGAGAFTDEEEECDDEDDEDNDGSSCGMPSSESEAGDFMDPGLYLLRMQHRKSGSQHQHSLSSSRLSGLSGSAAHCAGDDVDGVHVCGLAAAAHATAGEGGADSSVDSGKGKAVNGAHDDEGAASGSAGVGCPLAVDDKSILDDVESNVGVRIQEEVVAFTD
ncbi:hypothetical protein OC842_002384 [Tilletia horrida]|uniref:AB hydrolase-1 domain-containing protein n=1 Tax=Tilletia horrida TaxID=155126 RepID=A0AAN6GFF1_9BASI|nr:hypothetical protein OC842_002384 [Tilletia horrida]